SRAIARFLYFVSSDDAIVWPDAWLESDKCQMAAIPITARGAEMLKAELTRLKSIDRPGVIQAIKDAREKGDLSENAEYEAARERQGFIEGRIQELEGKLSSLQIIDPAAVDAGERIVFG